MRQINILNTREKKRIIHEIKDRFAFDSSILDHYVFLRAGQRVYITNRALSKIDTDKLRIDNIGLYIATIEDKLKTGRIRLSIEGSQLIGPSAEKNVLKIDSREFKIWISGGDLQVENTQGLESGFVIIKFGDDYAGSGLFIKSQGIVRNYIPKERRLKNFFE